MIIEEFKRVLFIHKGIVILVIMCVAVVISYLSGNSSYIGSEQYDTLSECYSLYEGKLTEGKLEQIYSEYEKYIGGYGSEPPAYESLYEAGVNAMQEMEEPYLVYENGWATLLSKLGDNYSMLLALLIFAILIFAYDSGQKVQNILNTSVNGRRRLVMVRVLVYTITSALIVLIHGFIEYVLADCLIGISCPDAPIQSLRDFRACDLNLSLIEVYILVLILKFIGALAGGFLVCLTATLAKNIYLSIICGGLVFFEGYFFSGLYGNPYLIPQHLFVSYYTLTEGNLNRVILVSAGVIVLLLIGIILINNEHSRRRLV